MLITGVTAALALAPLYHPGWPQDHEGVSFTYRTEIFAEHLRRGDLFPLWSSSDALGYGTPQAFYYHKAFYYVSGFFYLLGMNMKASLIIALVVFMFVGAVGMRRLLRATGITHEVVLNAVPPMFVLSNYAVNDWLVRGAMAEFTAMMVAPFVLEWAVTTATAKSISYSIVIAYPTLYFSHNQMALYILPVCLLALLMHLRNSLRHRDGVQECRRALMRCLSIATLLALLFFPYIVVVFEFGNGFSLHTLTDLYTPSSQYRPLESYLYDGAFTWLAGMKMNLQIGVHWIALGLLAPLCILRPPVGMDSAERRDYRHRLTLVIGAVTLYAFLLTPSSAPVYNAFHFLQYLQFPWRLLTLMTPLIIALSAATLEYLLRSSRPWGFVLVAATALAALMASPIPAALHTPTVRFFEPRLVSGTFHAGTRRIIPPGTLGAGEYLPAISDESGRTMNSTAEMKFYERLLGEDPRRAPIVRGCRSSTRDGGSEAATQVYTFSCEAPAEAVLPLNFSPLHKGFIARLDNDPRIRHAVHIYRTPRDPRIRLSLPPGRSRVEIFFPSLWGLLTK